MEKMLSPGTRVRLLTGPMGAVIWNQPYHFIDETFQAGYETDVSDVKCDTPGWIYLNTERDEVVIPVDARAVEVIA